MSAINLSRVCLSRIAYCTCLFFLLIALSMLFVQASLFHQPLMRVATDQTIIVVAGAGHKNGKGAGPPPHQLIRGVK